MARQRTAFDAWCTCPVCKDSFSVVLWVRSTPDGTFRARLEPTSYASAVEGALYHRPNQCGAKLRIHELPGRTVLET